MEKGILHDATGTSRATAHSLCETRRKRGAGVRRFKRSRRVATRAFDPFEPVDLGAVWPDGWPEAQNAKSADFDTFACNSLLYLGRSWCHILCRWSGILWRCAAHRPLSAEKSHRCRTSADNGCSLADNPDIRLVSVDLADNRQMSANPSHRGLFSAAPSDHAAISADPSNVGGLMADIPHTGALSRTFRRVRDRSRGRAAPLHARNGDHRFWRLKPPEGSGLRRSGDRAESLRIRQESCLARGRFHGFM